MVPCQPWSAPSHRQSGQESLLQLGVVGALLAGLLVLFAFCQALGAKGRHQRAADLVAISAAQVMRNNYGRLFEPPLLPNGLPNPRHLERGLPGVGTPGGEAGRGEQRAAGRSVAVGLPGVGFTPTRVSVQVRGEAMLRAPGDERARPVEVGARATAELAPKVSGLGMPTQASGGGYDGPLAPRQGKPKSHPSVRHKMVSRAFVQKRRLDTRRAHRAHSRVAELADGLGSCPTLLRRLEFQGGSRDLRDWRWQSSSPWPRRTRSLGEE
jgi:hypothetical protein